MSEESVTVHDQSEVKTCRLCCSEEQQELSLIFPECSSFDSSKLLLKKIFECTTVQITNEGDDRNALICQVCIDKIDDFYAYREQCKANDDRIRQRTHPPQIHIKQEKDLHLDISITEPISTTDDGFQQEDSSQPRPSSHSTTTTANEFQLGSEVEHADKDAEESLLLPMQAQTHHTSLQSSQVPSTDEITIKRETIVDDDDMYYNSDGEVASTSKLSQSLKDTDQIVTDRKAKYRIIMNANNRERLVYQGYLYCRHFSRRDGSIHWRCRLGGCQAAVNLHLDETITHANTNGHCHPQNGPDEMLDGDEVNQALEEGDDTQMDAETSYDQYGEEESFQEDMTVNDTELISVDPESLQIVTNKKKR